MAAAAALAFGLQVWLATSPAWVAGSVLVYLGVAVPVYRFWSVARGGFGWPNRVTLARAVLVAVLAGVLALPEIVQRHGAVLAALAAAALVLDGLDGWIARLLDGATRFGARFDMEVDALLILVLSIAVVLADRAGPWVLAIGGMRYAFVAAGRAWPWLRRELPLSRWRKFVCAAQGFVLAAALLPWLPPLLAQAALALALAALTHSFARDTLWLWRRRVRIS
ncbi:MAG: CDP-alcohol phosphatidyltransferase family protein [Wenzhouxiangellaceae bacterium]|nr:CDP-alcohol phosphatidyltransferase family protein [Wenzhouxiangellaceae bacterium]